MSSGPLFPVVEAEAASVLNELPAYAVATMPEPWAAVAAAVRNPPRHRFRVGDMELDHLERIAGEIPDGIETVVGLGGGSSLDTAKFVAWRRGLPLLQVPSIVSVDAAFTDAVGIRVGGRVRYVGNVLPEWVVLDLVLIRSAPPHMNRAGIGDILSCHTGLRDWEIAAERGRGVAWDPELADLGRRLLKDLEDALDDVRAVSSEGIRFLADAQRRVGEACHVAGHSRFEEGSEHFLAYCYEHRTRRKHLHGELICLCVAVMAHLQGNRPEWVVEVISRAGVRAHPDDIEVAAEDLIRALIALPAYAREENLDESVVDMDPPNERAARAALGWVATMLPRQDRAAGDPGGES